MRLLLVEDEKKVADFIARGLRAERYAVDVAYDGLSGWELAASVDYDLVILDLMLPGLNGTELLRRLRRKGKEAAVLVLTARDATQDKVENFEAGADDYLTKPFAFVELKVRVRASCGGSLQLATMFFVLAIWNWIALANKSDAPENESS